MTNTINLTPAEAEVMHVVWDRDAAGELVTGQDVMDRLDRPLAYTTVTTTLRILEEKGALARGEKRGRAFTYRPLVSRDAVRRSMVGDLANRLFGGSVKSLALSLIDTDSVSPEALSELRSAVESFEADEAKGDVDAPGDGATP